MLLVSVTSPVGIKWNVSVEQTLILHVRMRVRTDDGVVLGNNGVKLTFILVLMLIKSVQDVAKDV